MTWLHSKFDRFPKRKWLPQMTGVRMSERDESGFPEEARHAERGAQFREQIRKHFVGGRATVFANAVVSYAYVFLPVEVHCTHHQCGLAEDGVIETD
jgi:hypothetical protein